MGREKNFYKKIEGQSLFVPSFYRAMSKENGRKKHDANFKFLKSEYKKIALDTVIPEIFSSRIVLSDNDRFCLFQ